MFYLSHAHGNGLYNLSQTNTDIFLSTFCVTRVPTA